MKRCLVCDTLYPASDSACPACRWQPPLENGLPAYAPALSAESPGFRASHFAELAALEAGNFWFEARNRLIVWALRRYASDFSSFLEVGCGTGYVLSALATAFPLACVTGSEIFSTGLSFAASRLPGAGFMQMDARDIPFSGEFDAIGMFDVLEHIEEDETVLRSAHTALRPGGHLLLTVPQHQWLWSATDDYACHVRRYAVHDLHAKVRAAGFAIVRSTSFVSVLLPFMMLSRLSRRSGEAEATGAELSVAPWLNRLFGAALAAESRMIRAGVDFPAGGSRFLIAKKT
ncbi:class I SAM-dependent methyltransferase [Paraburkholderia sediminicola]|uniref:class I SAM-dependent methyltransferase n=1 Tax=Paraburkholderia sediminicola TaxID=458836 RepID=UPI0038BADFDA